MNAVDGRTRYNILSRLVWRRRLDEFDEFFKGLKTTIRAQIHEVFERERNKPVAERRLVTFVSDELGQYRRAFNRHFYRIAKLAHGVPIACKRYGLKHNNNPIERHNQDIKQRYKVMRHFKSFLGRGFPNLEESCVQPRSNPSDAEANTRRSCGNRCWPGKESAFGADRVLREPALR